MHRTMYKRNHRAEPKAFADIVSVPREKKTTSKIPKMTSTDSKLNSKNPTERVMLELRFLHLTETGHASSTVGEGAKYEHHLTLSKEESDEVNIWSL